MPGPGGSAAAATAVVGVLGYSSVRAASTRSSSVRGLATAASTGVVAAGAVAMAGMCVGRGENSAHMGTKIGTSTTMNCVRVDSITCGIGGPRPVRGCCGSIELAVADLVSLPPLAAVGDVDDVLVVAGQGMQSVIK